MFYKLWLKPKYPPKWWVELVEDLRQEGLCLCTVESKYQLSAFYFLHKELQTPSWSLLADVNTDFTKSVNKTSKSEEILLSLSEKNNSRPDLSHGQQKRASHHYIYQSLQPKLELRGTSELTTST